MLEFLPMIGMGFQALSALSAASNTARGYQQTPAEIAQLRALVNSDRLIKASLNPDDPITRNITAGENRGLNDSMQQGLSNLMAANRKAQLMGRQTFFNPERQDETISQWLNKSVDNRNNIARSNALKRILDAADAYRSNSSAYSSAIPYQQYGQNINNASLPTLFGAGADMFKQGGSLSNIFSMLSGSNRVDLGNQMPWLGT